MGRAKDILVKPIAARDACRIVRCLHYSGKVATTSQLHFGIFLDGKCGGAAQLGTPIDKRKALGAVRGTKWTGMLDLHRLALADWLPRNSESRVLTVILRLIRRTYPHIEWVQSYADGTQSGDGAIYRAAGFHLIGVHRNTSMYRMPDGEVCFRVVFEPGFSPSGGSGTVKARYGKTGSETAGVFLRRIGAELLPGFQLRYIYFLSPTARERLTIPILPYSEIERLGAGMYLGKARAGSADSGTPTDQAGGGGATPTSALSTMEVAHG